MREPLKCDYSTDETMKQWNEAMNTLSGFMEIVQPLPKEGRERLDAIIRRVRFQSSLFNEVMDFLEREINYEGPERQEALRFNEGATQSMEG